MASRPCRIALVVLLGVLVVGCGADPERPSPTDAITTDATTTTADTPVDVERYLLLAGELPGLDPVSSPFTDTGEPFDLPAEDVDLLDRTGYVSTTYQPAEGARSAGV